MSLIAATHNITMVVTSIYPRSSLHTQIFQKVEMLLQVATIL